MIAKILLPHGGNSTNTPKSIALHAMGQYIHVDKNTFDYYKAKGIVLELGRDYHAPEWLRAIGVSAHQLIEPSGMRIKCREDNQRAWHARGFNTNSLGVEFLVEGIYTYGPFLDRMKADWVTDRQYEEGTDLVRYWMGAHDINKNEINPHYKLSPGRKFDPGSGFKIEEFINDL